MAEDLSVGADLGARFAEFHTLSDRISDLRTKIDLVNQLNKDAAGKDDDTATAYHQQVDKPTKDLSDLIGNFSKVMKLVGDTGQDNSKKFVATEQDNTDIASSL